MRASVRSYRSAITKHIKTIISIHQDRIDTTFRRNDFEALLNVVDDGTFLSRFLVDLRLVRESKDLTAHELCVNLLQEHYQNSYDKVKRLADHALRGPDGIQSVAHFVDGHCGLVRREMSVLAYIMIELNVFNDAQEQTLKAMIHKHLEIPLTAHCEDLFSLSDRPTGIAMRLSATLVWQLDAELKTFKKSLLEDWMAYLSQTRV